MSRLLPWLVVVALLCAGCGESRTESGAAGTGRQAGAEPIADPGQHDPPPARVEEPLPEKAKSRKEDNEEPPFEDAAAEKETPKTVDRSRESLAGRWFLFLSQRGTDFPVALFEVSQSEEKSYRAKLLESEKGLSDPSLTSSKVSAESANLTVAFGDGSIDFQGTLVGGVVWGNVLFGGGRCDPARLIATEAKSMENNSDPQESQGRAEIARAFDEDDPVAALKRFAEKWPESPLALDAYEQTFRLAKQQKLGAAAVQETAAAYFMLAKRWGPRLEKMAHLNAATNLAATRYLPDLALKYLGETEKDLKDDLAEQWKPMIKTARTGAKVEQAISLVASGKEAEQRKAVETLRELQEEDRFNPLIAYRLADYAKKQGRLDEAIRQYAQLAVLPMMERMLMLETSQDDVEVDRPSETVARLWKKNNNDNADGLDTYLDQVYKESIYAFADKKIKPRPADGGNRIVLCELFTGSQCPPCLAADVATGGLEATYAKSELIVLRYHQHVPGPDPLSNEDSEKRALYYDLAGTPTTCVNGNPVQGVGGPMLVHVDSSYTRLREAIDPILSDKTDIQIKLAANAKDGVVSLSADVDGLEKSSGKLRLRLALAEEEIHYKAGNGIRLHEMVVRRMPGGPEGISPEKGRLSYRQSIKLSDLKKDLLDYLTAYEQGEGIEFEVKPLDLQTLHLVAFVQDDETLEVLQAATVPVSGRLQDPAQSKPDKPKTEPKNAGGNQSKTDGKKPAAEAKKPKAND